MTEVLGAIESFLFRDVQLVLLDLLDVAIVAFLIYRVLALLKGTRAMQMGMGLALVFIVYQVSRAAGLITLWSILDALLTYVVLIIVVVFQNDIRRALMRVGRRRPFLKAARKARETAMIEEVVRASASLAQKRIGALIVFERDAILDEFIERGTELDAEVTRELLYSIFIPSFENPMHDGAVILREGRVWQAGAFLPLTASPKLDRSLGTRHRAAIGISEETDAVVIVVSEERGSMSLCFNGNMVRNLDAASLREALLGLFYRPPSKKSRLRTSSSRPPSRTSVIPPKDAPAQTPRPAGEAKEPS